MANRGICWIDLLYNWAVIALIEGARFLGLIYEETNV
jgi:hypothetical protein